MQKVIRTSTLLLTQQINEMTGVDVDTKLHATTECQCKQSERVTQRSVDM